MEDKTTIVDTKSINNINIKRTLLAICEDLDERGYSPVKQIVAYLVSADPGYISNYKECRRRILEFKIEDILEVMLEEFMK